MLRGAKAKAAHAVVLVDLINPFDFDGAASLLEQTKRIVPAVQRLKTFARSAGWPIIYANDNFGQWRSNFPDTHKRALQGPGHDIAKALAPDQDDFFVLKPHRSAFFKTPLDLLLRSLDVEHLVIAGITTDMCVLATVNDALQRNLDITVPSDACATMDDTRQELALRLLSVALKTHVKSTSEVVHPR